MLVAPRFLVGVFMIVYLVEALAWAFLQSPQHSPYLLTAATCFCLLAILFTSKSKTHAE